LGLPSIEGIEKYLASGMIRGIGPVYPRKMVKTFGEKVFDIIQAEPDRMRGRWQRPVRARRITAPGRSRTSEDRARDHGLSAQPLVADLPTPVRYRHRAAMRGL
jgi:hypothetical protein